MKRDAGQLGKGPFDVLVIGGGIYGAWTAYDAALRGLSVALIDRSDWASGTSSASSKLIHGGLRYLEYFRLGQVRKSLDERRRLFGLAPHRVMPLRFILPLYSGSRVGPLRLRAGLWLYGALGGNGPPAERRLSLDRDETLRRYPFLNAGRLRGGLTFGDCQMDDAMFTLEIVSGAVGAGAVAVNYAEAVRLLFAGGRCAGAIVTDRLGQSEIEVRASAVVNTAGPWIRRLDGGRAFPIRLIKGVHLVLPALHTSDAVFGITERDGRAFFLLPWYGRTLLGTTDTDYRGDPSGARAEVEDVDYLLGEANRIVHDARWEASSIYGSFAGVRALREERGRPAASVSREWFVDEPAKGLLVSVGGKFTSARADAAEIVDRVTRMLGKGRRGMPPTETRPLPWCPDGEFLQWKEQAVREGVDLGLDGDTASTSAQRLGASVSNVHAHVRRDPALARRITPELPFSRAEVVHAAGGTMAVTLEDIVRRRIPLAILCRLDRAMLKDIATLAAPALDWTPERCGSEVRAVEETWRAV